MREFPILYKYTTKGQAQQWQIIADKDKFYTIEGIVDGKLTTSLPTFCKGKNIGKKNETTDEQQAILEAAAKHQKKIDSGYNEILTTKQNFFQPMLAHECVVEKLDFEGEEIFVQPKLDGLRGDNYENAITSRNGKPYLSVPHLYQDDNVRLDGELYNHDYSDDFNKIVSLCKKQKPTMEELEESAQKVQFWAYDMPSHPGKFSDRYAALSEYVKNSNNKSFVLVPTFRITSLEELELKHAQFMEMGYEGTIVRLNKLYENKRSKNLLKYKNFVDAEFKIVDAIEGEGGRVGTIGKFIMEFTNGKQFKSNVKGNFEYLRDIWKHRREYIGKMATVKYFNLTPEDSDGNGGVPRFPYVIKINREEYE
jgi:DNA ligase-1